MGALFADTNLICFTGHTRRTNIDIVAAGREIAPGVAAQGDVVHTGSIAFQCLETDRYVVVTPYVVFQRKKTIRRVVGASGIAKERFESVGRVVCSRLCS